MHGTDCFTLKRCRCRYTETPSSEVLAVSMAVRPALVLVGPVDCSVKAASCLRRHDCVVHVVVVGGGVSGLSCARLLLSAGHNVTVVGSDPLHQTTSYLAAAVWFPTAAGPPKPWRAGVPQPTASDAAEAAAGRPGVVMRETLVLYRNVVEEGQPLPAWADAVSHVRPARRDELPPAYPRGLRFVVPLVEMPTYPPIYRRKSCEPAPGMSGGSDVRLAPFAASF